MKTIALDTNVLITFCLKREPYFAEIEKLIQSSTQGKASLYIPLAACLEVEWVLR